MRPIAQTTKVVTLLASRSFSHSFFASSERVIKANGTSVRSGGGAPSVPDLLWDSLIILCLPLSLGRIRFEAIVTLPAPFRVRWGRSCFGSGWLRFCRSFRCKREQREANLIRLESILQLGIKCKSSCKVWPRLCVLFDH